MSDEEKIKLLILMDDTARKVNDEEVFEYWLVYGIPDGSTQDDFKDYVDDFEEFEKAFKHLMRIAKEDGLYKATEEELELAKKYEPDIVNII